MSMRGYKKNLINYPQLRKLAEDNPDIQFFVNPNTTDGSAFLRSNRIYLGARKKRINLITVALHELGHIRIGHIDNILTEERLAWSWAKKYAERKNIIINEEIMLEGFWSYLGDWLCSLTQEAYDMFSSLSIVDQQNIIDEDFVISGMIKQRVNNPNKRYPKIKSGWYDPFGSK